MSSNFVTLSREQFESYLPEGWTVVNTPSSQEIVYEVPTSVEHCVVRIYSSVDIRTGQSRGVGDDAVRVVLFDILNQRPLGKGKRIYRVEGATNIGDRIRQRVQEFIESSKGIEIKKRPTKNMWAQVDPAYVRAILESKALKNSNFAQSLLEGLCKYGSLTDGQVPYVLGTETPKGFPTFEATVKERDPGYLDRFINTFTDEEEGDVSEMEKQEGQEISQGVERKIHARFGRHLEPVDGSTVALVPTDEYQYHKFPYEKFNPLQSLTVEHQKGDTNIIISGATSSGKTICGEFFIDECFFGGNESNQKPKGWRRNAERNERKVIYTAPMKSLSSERLEDWTKRYPDRKVIMLTGDTLFNEKERARQMALAAKSDIIITTFELLDSICRKYHTERYYFLGDVGLLIMDESHCLTMENRGNIAESAVMKFTRINPQSRICFLSATMTNIAQLAEWLTVLNGKESRIVYSSWRPVPLNMNYVEYPIAITSYGREDYRTTSDIKENTAIELVMSKSDEKWMIFVHAKNTGRSIMAKLKLLGEEPMFHNADLDPADRKNIEDSFKQREGGIRVLISTSSTAIGVNLPARNVVVVGCHRGINEVDELELIQELGRCGRPQYDKEANGYLLIPEGGLSYWKGKIENPRAVSSVLKENKVLAFHVLAEIATKEIRDDKTMLEWYQRSLAYMQDQGYSLEDAQLLFSDLERMQMIERRADGRSFDISPLGLVSAALYYDPYTIYAWYKNFDNLFQDDDRESAVRNRGNVVYGGFDVYRRKPTFDDYTLAHALCDTPENDLGYIPKDVKDDVATLISRLTARGVSLYRQTGHMVLAAYQLLQGEDTDGATAPYARTIKYDIARISQALFMIDEMYARWRRKDIWQTLNDRIIYGVPLEMLGLVKIEGVGGKRARMLWEAGIHTPSEVADPDNKKRIIKMFKLNTAQKIISSAKKIANA